MGLKKQDFIEIEFTGRVKDGEIFDSNIKGDVEKINPDVNPKPFILSLGEDMFLKGIDNFLIGKEVGKYEIELEPKDAFGNRDPKFVQVMPIKVFHEQKINPSPGITFNFDGRIAKVLSVSGGRVIVDFNNPIAGKTVIYDINILRKLEDINEKVKSFIEFLFKKDLKFEIKDKKIIIDVEKGFSQYAALFKDKFKNIFGMDIELKEIEKKEEKKVEEKKD